MNEARETSILLFVLLALAMPALSCLICLLIPRRIMWLAAITSTLLMVVAVISASILYAKGWHVELTSSINWFAIGDRSLPLSILADSLSLPMLGMIVLISFLVHLYSVGFMADDRYASRYFSFLGFFTFAMLGLVISGNLLVLFCFWELVGFASWLLIGHWRERPEAAAAATKAFLFNRIGDALFIAGLMILWKNAGTFDILSLNTGRIEGDWITWAGLCIFCGVIGKSAQFPLLTWLPDAMQGPTPVSALIHAATMVAAGVFLLLRIPFILTPATSTVIAVVGSITALYGGWMALQQFDLKKILAYSTISQLGFMMLAIGSGSDEGAFVHLLAHAFFKACLFLGAGAIIHSLYQAAKQNHFDPQDVRNMGGWLPVAPRLFIATSLAAGALSGLPLLSGFISKEMIIVPMIHRALSAPGILPWLFVVVYFLCTLLTVLYTYRMFVSVFFGKRAHPHIEPTPIPPVMQWPVSLLAILSIWIFFAWSPFGPGSWLSHFHGARSVYLSQWSVIFPHSGLVTWLSIAWTALSLILAWWLFTKKEAHATPERYPLDDIYDKVVLTPVLRTSESLARFDKNGIDRVLHLFVYSQVTVAKVAGFVDRYIVDGTVTAVAWVTRQTGNILRSSPGTNIQSYLVWSALALIIFIFWLLK